MSTVSLKPWSKLDIRWNSFSKQEIKFTFRQCAWRRTRLFRKRLGRASGRKNVLRNLLRILYRRLKAGFSVCWLCSTVCLFVTERVLTKLNEMHKVWTFAPRKAFLLLCGFCFSSLENYFGVGTTNVKGKKDHSVSLRWNKEFWTFPKRRVFFWLFIRFICELISPSFAGLN